MINPDCLIRINELTDEERSIFLYRFVLKLSNKETSKCLNKPYNEILELDRFFRKEIFEEFGLEDML
jgi:DNA-directed RNA polymerase specialized sigma24 family protein